MTAAQLLQERIDAQQSLDAIEYGLRSIEACDGWLYCTGIHAGQLVRACYEAGRVLGRDGAVVLDNGCARLLRLARDQARARLKAAKVDCGGVRQLRLALAELAHQQSLAA